MTIRFGINPIGWTNDCMQWLGDFITLEQCLTQVKMAGFSGVELGQLFIPSRVPDLTDVLLGTLASLAGLWLGMWIRDRPSDP